MKLHKATPPCDTHAKHEADLLLYNLRRPTFGNLKHLVEHLDNCADLDVVKVSCHAIPIHIKDIQIGDKAVILTEGGYATVGVELTVYYTHWVPPTWRNNNKTVWSHRVLEFCAIIEPWSCEDGVEKALFSALANQIGNWNYEIHATCNSTYC